MRESTFGLGKSAAGAIAAITIREGVRARLPLAWLCLLFGLAGLQSFLGALALIDAGDVVLSVSAPIARLLAVLVTAVFVIAPLSRELGDGGADIMFAAPVPRAWWVLGRMAGHGTLAIGTAISVSLPLTLHAPAAAVLAWGTSLALESLLVAALAVLITISLVRLPLALLALLATYACARMIGVIEMLGRASDQTGWFDGFIHLLALVLPRLDLNAVTGWLLPGDAAVRADVLLPGLAQTALYGLIVIVAASLDIERRRA
ncbi:MAG: hypothetical protein R3E87_13270 [Burkholderiaceae bacterium]